MDHMDQQGVTKNTWTVVGSSCIPGVTCIDAYICW